MMAKIDIKNNASDYLKKLSERISSNVCPESVQDATQSAMIKWKQLIPKDTALSASNIYKIINNNKNVTEGLIISPKQVKPNSFYLNVFLEMGGAKGSNIANIKGRDIKYNGLFGAASLTVDATKDYFKSLITSKVKTTINAFK